MIKAHTGVQTKNLAIFSVQKPDVACWTAWTTHPLFFHRYFDYAWLVLVNHISGSQMLWRKMLHFAENQQIVLKKNKQTKKPEWCTQKSDFQTRPFLFGAPLRVSMFPAALRRAGRGVASYDFVVVGGGATGGDGTWWSHGAVHGKHRWVSLW